MSDWVRYTVLSLVLAGCGSTASVPTPYAVKCPPIEPEVVCMDWPVRDGETVESLVVAYLDGKIAHKSCKVALKAWREAWNECE